MRHEEAAAFAVGAQAQVTGRLGVCMGTVGPGSVHLLNGLYDAKKSHAPVLAILGQVPTPEIGSEFFQEVDNHRLFADVAVFSRTVTDPPQMPLLLEQAVNVAYDGPGVAVLTVPGDMGSQKLPRGSRDPVIAPPASPATADPTSIDTARGVLRKAEHATLLRHGDVDRVALALRTAVAYQLPVKILVFDNGRLGMVKLEQEQGGLPEFGTELDNPDLARVADAMGLTSRAVGDPNEVESAVTWLLEQDGPALLDVRTNPDEISLQPKAAVGQGWGFAIAKVTENLPLD